MIFQGKCFPCYILLTDQISLPDCHYFLRHWAVNVLQFCLPRCNVINFEIKLGEFKGAQKYFAR